jgi:hypothetical protein
MKEGLTRSYPPLSEVVILKIRKNPVNTGSKRKAEMIR